MTEIPANSTENKTFLGEVDGPYSINYELDGGTNPAKIPKPIPLKYDHPRGPRSVEGYTFGGWYETADFSGNPVTGIPANSTENKTLLGEVDG